MFAINKDQSIFLTRGDVAVIKISADTSCNENYTFKVGDVVRFRLFKKNKPEEVLIQKDVIVDMEKIFVEIPLLKEETKLGEVISKPQEYWYEVELNPDTAPQTLIGYDANGPKIFKIFPEGSDI